jgi:hypothetical protein
VIFFSNFKNNLRLAKGEYIGQETGKEGKPEIKS